MNRTIVPLVALAVSAALATPIASYAANSDTPHSAKTAPLLGQVAADVRVTGVLVDHDGNPIDNYNVYAHDDDGELLATSLTYGGRYHLWLPEGVDVSVTGSDNASPAVWADADLGRVTGAVGTVRLGRTRLLQVAPTMVRTPALIGKPVVGRTLTADTGAWTHRRTTKLTATVEWLRGTKVVGTGTSYVAKAEDVQKDLRFVVQVAGRHTATASAESARITVKQPKAAVKLTKVTVTKKKVVVVLKVSGKKKQAVRLRTKAGAIVAKTSGRGTVKLTAPALKKKQKQVVYFAGSARLGWVKAVARR